MYYINGVLKNSLDEIVDSIPKNEKRLFEEVIKNHKDISIFNPYAVSTVRVVSIRQDSDESIITKDISIFSCFLRIGTKEDSPTDNGGQGGIFININENGLLNKYGMYLPAFGTKTYKHPLSNIYFENYKLPYWNETIELVKEAHIHFYGVKTIGWDVAITENGPILLEANIDWNFPMGQIVAGPLKEKWKKMFYN